MGSELILLLASFAACASSERTSCLPEKYLNWTIADASITMKGSEVVKSEIIVTLDGKSIQLDYENGQLKESDAISQKNSLLSGDDLYQTDGEKLTKTSYDGAGGIAWASIMDGDYKQVYTLILR